MRTDIELLELLKQRAKDWYALDPNATNHDRWCFRYKDQISYGLCGIISTMMYITRELTLIEYIRLDDLIMNHRESIASHMSSYNLYSPWYFQRGALEPRLEYIDLIIEKNTE